MLFSKQFFNEGTVKGTFRVAQKQQGPLLVQECRRDWHKRANFYSYDEIDEQAKRAWPSQHYRHGRSLFLRAGGMQKMIQAFCKRTWATHSEDGCEVARCIYDSPRSQISLRGVLEIIAGDESTAQH
jgi:hypothetical protein